MNDYHHYLSNTLEECCEKFYSWDLFKCNGVTPILTNGDFYPDWDGRTDTCLNDGNFPPYMLNDQSHYLSATLEQCCKKHYGWAKSQCLGTSAAGSSKWYVDWTSYSCVQDCEGGNPCGGHAENWDELYSSKEKCCRAKLPWMRLRACLTA